MTAVEGSAFNGVVASFTDADPNAVAGYYSATINWGDGHLSSGTVTANAAGGFNVSGTHTYAAAGNYSIAVAIQDVGGASTSGTSSARVSDAPLAASGAALTAVEGSAFNGVVASFTDADPNAVAGNYSATINWGDGASSAGAVSANGKGGFNVTGTHTYAAAGDYSVSVAIQDVGGASTSGTSSAAVADAPLSGSGTAVTAVEGSAFNGVVASFTDADPNAVAGYYSATINWGDGASSAGAVSANGKGGFNVTGTHTYTAAGNYSVGVAIQDVGGASTSGTSSARVSDAPLAASGAALTAVEGSAFNGVVASFTDADPNAVAGNYSATINWGDGASSAAAVSANATGGFNVSGTHTYTAAGNYSIGVAIQDVGGASTSGTSSAAVADAPLAGSGTAVTAVEGSAFNGVVASFTDADPNAVAGNYSATINWGDGHVSSGTVTANATGGFNVSGTHTYTEAGNYSIGVAIQDVGGASTSGTSSAAVSDAPLSGSGTAVTAVEGSPFTGVVASFTDADPNAVAGNYSATINWGDGHVSSGTVTANATGGFNVSGTHTYTEAGNYSIGVAIQDVGGASTSGTGSAAVSDAPLSGSGTAVTAVEGSPFNGVVASFTDADPNAVAGNYSATINWGDGHVSSGTVTANPAGGFNVSGTHTYTAAGNYSIGVAIQDAGGASTSGTSSAAVSDAPLSGSGTAVTGVEGSPFTGVVASFTDADPNAVAGNYSATINWGDGASSTGAVSANGRGGFNVSGQHSYAEEGSYATSVTILDVGGASTSAHGTAMVSDAALSATSVSFSATAGALFSGPVANFSDADASAPMSDYTASTDWGDGTTSAGTIAADGHGGYVVTNGHTYSKPGSFTVRTTILDKGTSNAGVSTTVVVSAPAALSGTGLTVKTTEGQLFSGAVALFSDTDKGVTANDFTATIDWGDGSRSTSGSVHRTSSGVFTVTGAHTYADEGSYVIRVVGKVHGATATVRSTANVADSVPLLVAAVLPGQGRNEFVLLGAYADAASERHTAVIHWGDGNDSTVKLGSGNTGTFEVTHSYARLSSGQHPTIVVTVEDDQGTMSKPVSLSLPLANIPPPTNLRALVEADAIALQKRLRALDAVLGGLDFASG